MLAGRWLRLCRRAVHSGSVRGGRWGTTLAGHSSRKCAIITVVPHGGAVASSRLCHSGLGDLYEDERVQRHLQQLTEEHRDLIVKLQQAYLSESDRKVLTRRHTELLPLANICGGIEQALKDHEEVVSLLHGGLHHAAVRIAGDNVYRHMKHEGGTHRVQRIPEMGLSSRMQRIHTGTMTVIILPQPVEFDVHIDPKDLRIDTFRSRGAGGQSVNTTDSAVRIVHLPTGVTVECQQTRSQLQNRDNAIRVLRARLYQSMLGKETKQRHMARKQQVGTRSQSDRIRTYNFSQDRVTDHRTGYVTRDIKEFMRGGEALDDLISDVFEQAERDALLEMVERCSSSSLTQPESAD
ncbi:hypothetical protein F2P81_002418 [Scophthalmus maximus]|uniref:Prokaryotic-type class I peptide chain release factors domain-containing protein n=1 Tax=Scophthalmus maximus TaxID=52904 RepID=A0A6A4TM22_SCOMX|nr:hypothetical protein F2P81_002418 [Scophthalmus maximus]